MKKHTLLLLTLLFIAGCSPTSQETIDIGVIAPITGDASSYGEPAVNAIRLAAKEINTAGGILDKQVNLIVEDGACDAKAALNAVNKLLYTDNVHIILGGHCSTESLTIAPLINKEKALQLATLTSAEDFSDAGEYSFRNYPTGNDAMKQLARIAKNEGTSRIAGIYEEKEFPQSQYESFAKNFEGQIISAQKFLPGTTDFRTIILKATEKNPDALYFSSQGSPQAIAFYKQMHEMGLLTKYPIYVNSVGVAPDVQEESGHLLGPSIKNVDAYLDESREDVQIFLDAYKKIHGHYPKTNYYYVASAYDSLYLIKDAMVSCTNEKPDCIKTFLKNLKNWNGLAGVIHEFNEQGDAELALGLHYFDETGEKISIPVN